MKPEILSRRLYNSQQSWHLVELLRMGSDTVRLTIRSNAYVEQSWATVERWDGHEWRTVVTRAGVELESRQSHSGERRPVSYTQKELTPDGVAAFMTDRDVLLNEAALVLSA